MLQHSLLFWIKKNLFMLGNTPIFFNKYFTKYSSDWWDGDRVSVFPKLPQIRENYCQSSSLWNFEHGPHSAHGPDFGHVLLTRSRTKNQRWNVASGPLGTFWGVFFGTEQFHEQQIYWKHMNVFVSPPHIPHSLLATPVTMNTIIII